MAKDPREWSPYAQLSIKLNAGHTQMGNPRRGWIVIDTSRGDAIDFIDEGYRGRAALTRDYPNIIEGPEIPVAPSVYREYIRFGREQAERHGL